MLNDQASQASTVPYGEQPSSAAAAAATATDAAAAPANEAAKGLDDDDNASDAETIAYDDFVAGGGEAGAKESGNMRAEGRDYQVRDGDILLFRFNV